MTRWILVTAALCASLSVSALPAHAANGPETHRFSYIEIEQFLPCAGETIHMSGQSHFMLRGFIDAQGGSHFVSHVNYQGISGEGLASGTRYRAVASDQSVSHNFDPFVGAPYHIQIVQNVRFVGQGPDNDLIIRFRTHVTVNANYVVVSETWVDELICVG
jgi:hypothetical protein